MVDKYAVEIYDDELCPKRWRRVAFQSSLDKEVFRSSLGRYGSDIRYTTTDIDEAKAKEKEMKDKGWKVRVVPVEE